MLLIQNTSLTEDVQKQSALEFAQPLNQQEINQIQKHFHFSKLKDRYRISFI